MWLYLHFKKHQHLAVLQAFAPTLGEFMIYYFIKSCSCGENVLLDIVHF